MFDRTACPDPQLLAAHPFISIDAFSALSALLDLALKDQTPSAVDLDASQLRLHRGNLAFFSIAQSSGSGDQTGAHSRNALISRRSRAFQTSNLRIENAETTNY
jgi:hypothetical protein